MSGPRARSQYFQQDISYHCFLCEQLLPSPQMKTTAIGSPGEEAPPSLREDLSPLTLIDQQ